MLISGDYSGSTCEPRRLEPTSFGHLYWGVFVIVWADVAVSINLVTTKYPLQSPSKSSRLKDPLILYINNA